MSLAIVWFRQDLRLADNPALRLAVDTGQPVLPVFIDDPTEGDVSRTGSASRVWLHHSLKALADALAVRGAPLVVARGPSLDVLRSLIAATGARRIFWNRQYGPSSRARDQKIKTALAEFEPVSANALLLFEPWEALKGNGSPYRVFTPFWRALAPRLKSVARYQPAPQHISGWRASNPRSLPACVVPDIDALGFLPRLSWPDSLIAHWEVGEAKAARRLDIFLQNAVRHYDTSRDLPGEKGTSRLSPHLHFGELGPRQVLAGLFGRRADMSRFGHGETLFAKEILWREFGYSLLYHFPHSIEQPLDERFAAFPWRSDIDADLRAWQRGQTGIPFVDAGMRELYATGWMHNRMRMVVASYLVKNLLIPWQYGERWFRDTLVDADLASNCLGWQWAAGCGADAAPFFRVFNPVVQGKKFDAEGLYVRRWLPELADVPLKKLHMPWELDAASRSRLDYPPPQVDLKVSRARALEAFKSLKRRD